MKSETKKRNRTVRKAPEAGDTADRGTAPRGGRVVGLGGKRRNGSVARLSKEVRDKLNVMLDDGVPYAEIVKSLGEDGKGLSAWNLTRWKDGGHQDWLAERAFVEQLRMRQETPRELVKDFDATEVNHAALQLGTLHIFEAMRELREGSLKEKLGGDCEAFARLVNALARVSRETIQLQKYREACACAKARTTLPQLDIDRKLDERENRVIVRKVDEVFGLEPISDPPGDELSESGPLIEELPEAGGSGDERAEPSACPGGSTPAAVDSAVFPSEEEGSDLAVA